MPADMPNHEDMPDIEILAAYDACPPGEQCPKVARRRPGKIVVVAPVVTGPSAGAAFGVGVGEAAVEIDESLYRRGYHALGPEEEEGEVA